MRDDEDESVRWLKHFDRAQEIAHACPGTRVVTVCDKEGDGAVVAGGRDGRWLGGARPPAAARAARRRQQKGALGLHDGTAGADQTISELRRLRRQAGAQETRGDDPRRLATGSATRLPPCSPVAGDLDRLLLAAEGDPGKANAVRIVEWYERRWTIEEYFRALMTGSSTTPTTFESALPSMPSPHAGRSTSNAWRGQAQCPGRHARRLRRRIP